MSGKGGTRPRARVLLTKFRHDLGCWRSLDYVEASPATVATVVVASGFEDRLRKDAPLLGDRVRTPESLRLLSGHKTGHTTQVKE